MPDQMTTTAAWRGFAVVRRWTLVGIVVGAALLAQASGPTSNAAGGEASCAGRGDATFRAADKTRLVGHAFGRGTTAVVLAHQLRSNMCQWLAYARRLSSKGYRVLVFDFRNHGISQHVGYGRRSWRYAADVAAATKFVRARGARKVFLVGASMGGTAVLAAGANLVPAVDGVVSLSAPLAVSGADAEAAVPRLRVPVLYLAASEDAAGGFAEHARALYEATASSEKTIEIVPGAAHGVSLVTSSGRARDHVEQFLASHR
jgi:alpha-beta hydrolase superfamily lysophospholipase